MTYRKKKIQHLFDEIWNNLIDHLDDFVRSGQPESLHQFRVHIKKAKALVRIYIGKPGDPLQACLKTIFREAGKVRSIWIHQELLQQWHADPAYFRELSIQYEWQSAIFLKRSGKFRKQLLKTGKRLRDRFSDIPEDELTWRFLVRIDRIEEMLNRTDAEAYWHEARKRVKVLLYAYSVSGNKFQTKIPLHTKYLDELQEMIGEWHDIQANTAWMDKRIPVPRALAVKSKNLSAGIRQLTKRFIEQVFTRST